MIRILFVPRDAAAFAQDLIVELPLRVLTQDGWAHVVDTGRPDGNGQALAVPQHARAQPKLVKSYPAHEIAEIDWEWEPPQ